MIFVCRFCYISQAIDKRQVDKIMEDNVPNNVYDFKHIIFMRNPYGNRDELRYCMFDYFDSLVITSSSLNHAFADKRYEDFVCESMI